MRAQSRSVVSLAPARRGHQVSRRAVRNRPARRHSCGVNLQPAWMMASASAAALLDEASGRLQVAHRRASLAGGRRPGRFRASCLLGGGALLHLACSGLGGAEHAGRPRCRFGRRATLLGSVLLELTGGWLEGTGLGGRLRLGRERKGGGQGQEGPKGQGGEGNGAGSFAGLRHAPEPDGQLSPRPWVNLPRDC